MKSNVILIRALFLSVLFFLSACEANLDDNAPRTELGSMNKISDASSVIDTDIIGNTVCLSSAITGLIGNCIPTILVNSINAPSGNETSVFEGVVPVDRIPSETYTYSTTYAQDGKLYSAFTELTTSGQIHVTLHYRATNEINGGTVWIGPSITGLAGNVLMTVSNEVNAPSGNETTIFDGVISATKMAEFFPQGLNGLYTYSTTYFQDGKAYSADTQVNEQGKITVKMHYKAPKK